MDSHFEKSAILPPLGQHRFVKRTQFCKAHGLIVSQHLESKSDIEKSLIKGLTEHKRQSRDPKEFITTPTNARLYITGGKQSKKNIKSRRKCQTSKKERKETTSGDLSQGAARLRRWWGSKVSIQTRTKWSGSGGESEDISTLPNQRGAEGLMIPGLYTGTLTSVSGVSQDLIE